MKRMLVVAILAVLRVAGIGHEDTAAVPVVATQEGRISGILEESTKGMAFYSYYGIPFARPPLGDLRLKDPVAAEPWEGVRDGSSMPEMCLQVPFGEVVAGKRPPPEGLSGSEDCLYLNVFTPAPIVKEAELPVMVWIHGGGFFGGGANEYLPHVLLDHDIVLVVIQYRLGLLGFLSTEDSVIPGNFGLKDQTMALHWVQTNIHSFGGDKTRVTIFGQSAGGASVHYHLLSAKSDGLFSRAIVQSGSALSSWARGRMHEEQVQHVADVLGCSIQESSEAFLACLQTVDGRELAFLNLDFFRWFILPMTFGPRVDGDLVLEEPGQLMREGRHKKVDLMIGNTAHEGSLFTQVLMDQDGPLEEAFSTIAPLALLCYKETADPPSVARRIYRYYQGEGKLDQEAQSDMLTRMISDRINAVDIEEVALHHARDSANSSSSSRVFRYVLTYRSQLSMGRFLPNDVPYWVSHGDDLYYLFRGGPFLQPEGQPPEGPQDLKRKEDLTLRDTITTLWTNFASTGNPTPDDSLGFIWEPSTEDNLHYLDLKPQPTMEPDQRQEVRRFHASLPTITNLALHPHLVQEEPVTAGLEENGAADHSRNIHDEQ